MISLYAQVRFKKLKKKSSERLKTAEDKNSKGKMLKLRKTSY